METKKSQLTYLTIRTELHNQIGEKMGFDEDRSTRTSSDVVYEGWVMKRGEHIKTWRQRYLVLFKDGSLLGFKNKPIDENYDDPLNDFTVKDVQMMQVEKPKANCFLVRGLQLTTVIERLFCADTPEIRTEWMNIIKNVANSIRSEFSEDGGENDIEVPELSRMEGTPLEEQVLDESKKEKGGTSSHLENSGNLMAMNDKGSASELASSENKFRGVHSQMTVADAGAEQLEQLEKEEAGRSLPESAGNSRRSSNQSRIGLHDFEFIKVLGKGTFGKVILSREKLTGKLYAIKILKKQVIIAKEEVEHTLTENRVLQKCRHPFLTDLTYSFQTQDRLCFVMEFANGGDLYYHLNRHVSRFRQGFSEDRTRFYGAEIILAIGYLHDRDIVYRDLKLENLLLDRMGHVKIADFGLCKEDISFNGRTRTFCGTPEYLAPEVLEESEYGRAVDWWGLGVVMYEMMCGRLPFYSREHERLFRLIMQAIVRYPNSLSDRAKLLLAGLLTKDPETRLGGSPSDYREIQNTQFFKGLNWEALYKREVEPPFKPQLESDLDTSYFDPDFTNETVQLTPTSDVRSQQLETVQEMDENGEFIQFSFNRIGSGPLVSTQF